MAESTCLHIQDHDAGPIRIVEIPWVSARVGRAAYCEVRLTDPSLPEEACRLHRRGRSWRLTPMNGADVLLDGEPIDGPRPLAFDIPFQVGPFRLALKPGKFAEPDWRPVVEPPLAAPRPFPAVEPVAAPLGNPWEARWRDAGDRLKAARAAEPQPAPPTPTPTPPPVPVPPPPAAERPSPREIRRPSPPAAPRYEPPARPRYEPPSTAAPKYEPRAYARPTPSAAPRPVPRRPAPPVPTPAPEAWTRPVPAPAPPVAEAPTSPPPEPPTRRFHFLDADALARLEAADVDEAIQAAPEPTRSRIVRRRSRRALVDRRATSINRPSPLEGEGGRRPDEGWIGVAPAADAAPLQDRADRPSPLEGEGGRRPDEGWIDREPSEFRNPSLRRDPEPIGPSSVPSGHLPQGERENQDAVAAIDVEPASGWAFPTGPFVADTSGYGFGPRSVGAEPSRSDRAMAPRSVEVEEDPAEFDPTRARRSRSEDAWVLPSVQDVLNNGLNRARAEAGAIPRPASRSPRPSLATPTEAVEPAHWSLPAWLAAPPALAATLAVGGLLAYCSWRQATVSHVAATVIQTSADVRLAGAAAKERPLPAGMTPPKPSWWSAAPEHLAEWGVYLDGAKVEHGFDATAEGMFEAAAAIGPLDPLARLALARKRGDAVPATGLSRDAAALAWTGRTLHRAGKDAEAIRAYRRALEVAARAEPPRDAPLDYSDDPNIPRYLLPGEALAAAVVADLAADDSWSYRDWAAAVPETGVPALAAARVLRKEGRSEADAILRRIIERAEADAKTAAGDPDEPEAGARDRAVALAVAAEALALRADWNSAAGRYRAAIDQMDDPRVRRSWWFNLADVAAHARDDDQRRAALDEALAATSSDEVGRRVLELRRGPADAAANRLRSNGTKAN